MQARRGSGLCHSASPVVAPTITTQPSDQTVFATQNATFGGASGFFPPTVQWLVSTDGGSTFDQCPKQPATR